MVIRRLRGIVASALTWGAAWSLLGLAYGGYVAFYLSKMFGRFPAVDGKPLPFSLSWVVFGFALSFGRFGLLAGLAYALAVIGAESRSRSVAALSLRRVAACGALTGLVSPLWNLSLPSHVPFWVLAMNAAITAVLGGGLATSMLLLARRAPADVLATPAIGR